MRAIVETTARCPHFSSALAAEFATEWPEWACTLSPEELEACFQCGENGTLPVVFVAHHDGVALGTVALRQWFGEEPMPESPWVRGLYVTRDARGKGIDRLLLSVVEKEAARRGYANIYAATTRIERLAMRRGWSVFRRIDYRGEPMAWMRRPVPSWTMPRS